MSDQLNRRNFIHETGLGVAALAGSSASSANAASSKKPNVLLVHVDQHRFDCLGVCGNPDVQTPNIDSLAADGVRFDNSFCPYPVCTPSRYSLISGQYVHEHRGFSNHCTLAPDIATFPKMLRAAGYKTKAVGKMHFTPTYLDVGFDEMELSEQNGPGRWDDDYHRYLMRHGLVDYNDLEDQEREHRKNAPEKYFKSFGALVSNLPDKHHSTTWVGDRAVETLKTWDASKPHLLMAGFIKPHHPFDPPAPWHEKYDPEKLTILPGWTEACLDRDYQFSRGYFDNKTLNIPALRKVMAFYYATITQIDHHVGRMIEVLKKKGLYDNTTIVFTSDHGEFLGFHHLLLKGNYMYDALAKVPLIVKYPGSAKAGTVSQAMVNNVDVGPTILQTAGLQPASSMKGLDLRQAGKGHDIVFCGRTEIMARSRTRKLILSQRKGGQNLFFDLENDPLEMKNLYGDPAYQKEIRAFKDAVDAWQPESARKRKMYLDENAPQIDRPNVPDDRSHRPKTIDYFKKKMQAS